VATHAWHQLRLTLGPGPPPAGHHAQLDFAFVAADVSPLHTTELSSNQLIDLWYCYCLVDCPGNNTAVFFLWLTTPVHLRPVLPAPSSELSDFLKQRTRKLVSRSLSSPQPVAPSTACSSKERFGGVGCLQYAPALCCVRTLCYWIYE
jgi:hypothetical protein